MRHKVDGRKFDRNTAARNALFRNLVTQLFKHDRIVTTEAKAKEVRRLAEKMITHAKKESLHARRQVLRVLTEKAAFNRLFDVILAKLSGCNSGGYTRIIKIGNRKGDDAPMVLLEIIEPGAGKRKSGRVIKKRSSTGKEKGKGKKEKKEEGASFDEKRALISEEKKDTEGIEPSSIKQDLQVNDASPESDSIEPLNDAPAEKSEKGEQKQAPSAGEGDGAINQEKADK
ncbi:50S ribosomal protein L17 [bacterium]|nr:50S ribosomal protein L17 [bacterium]